MAVRNLPRFLRLLVGGFLALLLVGLTACAGPVDDDIVRLTLW